MPALSVIYYSANRERPEFERLICDRLAATADGLGLPVVSVTQKPSSLGYNICVGDVGASYRNCYRQALIGCRTAETDFVAFAESDALYPAEFFRIPEDCEAWIGNNLWVVYADRPGRYFHKGPSDGLLVGRRDWVIERLEQRLAGLPEWGPGKTKPLVGSNAEMVKFDHAPVISFKTGASMNPATGHSGRVEASLEPWGDADALAVQFGLSGREPSESGPYALSVLIPARNENFPEEGVTASGQAVDLLNLTVRDVLDHSGPRTEVIVALDGEWPLEALPQHPRLSVLYNADAVGQRAGTNQAARLAQGKWVMKLDAHCALAPGFDEAMLAAAEGHDDWTLVPAMYNLHAFDWHCQACGNVRYQGPEIPECQKCGAPNSERIEIVWGPRQSARTTAWRFDRDLRFKYWRGDSGGEVAETMCLLGACWMVTKERYFAMNICDENHGAGWGQQGVEVSCKSWLSGGAVMTVLGTWFGHLFRTRDGFGFPYPNHNSDRENARSYSRQLWNDPVRGTTWDGAVRPLSWLVEHFKPAPDWHDDDGNLVEPFPTSGQPYVQPKKGIVYYTHNQLGTRLAKTVQRTIEASGLPIVSASLKPMGFGRNVRLRAEPGVETMFRQILAGLEASDARYVFLCEHDVAYHPSHFEFVPLRDNVFYYNTHVFKVRLEDGFAVRVDDCRQTSGLCASRDLLLEHYRERLRRVETEGFTRAMGFEPGTHSRAERVDDYGSETWESEFPNVDIRHGGNLTRSRWSPSEYRNKRFAEGWTETTIDGIPGWENISGVLGIAVVRAA